jgi:hypothetical protein
MGERDVVLTLSRITDENSTIAIRFKNTKQLLDANLQFIEEFGNTGDA